jgi:hypothetical protein
MNGGGVEDGRRDDSKLKQLQLANASHPGAAACRRRRHKAKDFIRSIVHHHLRSMIQSSFTFETVKNILWGPRCYTRSSYRSSSSPRQKSAMRLHARAREDIKMDMVVALKSRYQ